MLKYDPLASMINAELAERMRLAEQIRLRRAAVQARKNNLSVSIGPRGPRNQLPARASRLWSSLIHVVLGRQGPAPEIMPEK